MTSWLSICEWTAQRVSLRLGRALWMASFSLQTIRRDGWAAWWGLGDADAPREPEFWTPDLDTPPSYEELDRALRLAIRQAIIGGSFHDPYPMPFRTNTPVQYNVETP